MPRRPRSWLARQVPSARGAAAVTLLFLAGAVISAVAGGALPAAFFAGSTAFVLTAYLATYGAAWPPREDEERLG